MLAQQEPTTWTVVIVTMVLVGLILVASGLAVSVIAQRTADGRIGPNGIAGIRTRATNSSDEAWLAAHREGRKLSVWGGWVMALSAPVAAGVGVLVGVGRNADRAMLGWGIAVGVGAVASTALIVTGAVRGHRAAVAVRDHS
jgi:uncharacterized membrane protein